MENVISNAERRAIRNDEKLVVPRISDVYAALPPSPANSNWSTKAR